MFNEPEWSLLNPSTKYKVLSNGNMLNRVEMFEIDAYKVDVFDQDLEDDDMELYYRLKNSDQILIMKVR